jgi:hypothetical integral membrane protein (TIGR02206 family)
VDRPFHIFGASHLAAMLATVALAAGLTLLARRAPGTRRLVERGLALALLAATLVYVALELAAGTASIWTFAPLHLCDMAIFVAAFALWTRHPLAGEVAYFWAFAGTSLAIVTPDVAVDFPAASFVFYFALHAGVVAAAAVLVLGSGLRPRRWAPLRVWLVTNAYAAIVALVNLGFDENYLYLMAPPAQPTLLDWFGPWPVYLLVCEALALGLFALLYLPFWRRGPGATRARLTGERRRRRSGRPPPGG